MNTIRIYETDSHARRLQARVLSCEESENGCFDLINAKTKGR